MILEVGCVVHMSPEQNAALMQLDRSTAGTKTIICEIYSNPADAGVKRDAWFNMYLSTRRDSRSARHAMSRVDGGIP